MHKGSCLCGAVRFEIEKPLKGPDACHCSQCRKVSGHVWASTDLAEADLRLDGAENLTWFQSSEKVRRGFCATCGAALFWKPIFKDTIAVAMGAFETPTQTRLAMHIFVADKGDYYEIADGVPQKPQ
ncbi:GFA family protein [Sphingosinicella sp. BN140058]|uniref:GFA family protein n=1 Tax=Sphingosinicella sp. BN140058 TaxID=1892855 RepID=UPI00101216F7|nr:GFA family protein [Sphingosinicella sp. BN140058]QAY77824.1 GFA family protein [Sphingosinicella sp. BN140058]